MRPYNTYLNRIQKIQEWYKSNTNKHSSGLYNDLKSFKHGTISCTLSLMKQAGHLVAISPGFYALPSVVCSPEKVAQSIAQQGREKRAGLKRPKKLVSSWLGGFVPEQEKSSSIEAAIELLKSNGYKILKPTTEFKEI